MDRYAVIGQPIAHSQSPRIHAAFAAQLDQQLLYTAIDVPPGRLAEALATLHADGFRGLNVTLPHKAEVAALCERVSERAQLAGAVNTLARTDRGWVGDNTDGEGLLRDLERLGIVLAGRRVLLLGAGGAARGVIAPVLSRQPAELVLSNRNPWKPEQLAEHFKALGPIRPCTHLALKGDRFDLVLNATSAGHQNNMPRLPDALLSTQAACYDLSYGAAHAPFRAWALAQGARLVADGLGMLVEQAASSYAIWRGVRPETATVLAMLRGSPHTEGQGPFGGRREPIAASAERLRRPHVELPPQD